MNKQNKDGSILIFSSTQDNPVTDTEKEIGKIFKELCELGRDQFGTHPWIFLERSESAKSEWEVTSDSNYLNKKFADKIEETLSLKKNSIGRRYKEFKTGADDYGY